VNRHQATTYVAKLTGAISIATTPPREVCLGTAMLMLPTSGPTITGEDWCTTEQLCRAAIHTGEHAMVTPHPNQLHHSTREGKRSTMVPTISPETSPPMRNRWSISFHALFSQRVGPLSMKSGQQSTKGYAQGSDLSVDRCVSYELDGDTRHNKVFI
jgi:hypothetical protein